MNNLASILEQIKVHTTEEQYNAVNIAIKNMTADTAMQSFMVTYEMLNDTEKPVFIERLKIKLDNILNRGQQ